MRPSCELLLLPGRLLAVALVGRFGGGIKAVAGTALSAHAGNSMEVHHEQDPEHDDDDEHDDDVPHLIRLQRLRRR